MRDRSAILTIFGLSTALTLLSIWNGLGQTHDSIYYLDEASKLSKIGLSNYFTQNSFQQKLLITFLSYFSDNTCSAAAILNTFCFVGSVTIWFSSSRSYFTTQTNWFAFGLLLVFNTPMLLGISFLWSESAFYFLFSLAFYQMKKVDWRPKLKKVVFLILIGVLLVFARKAGMLFILGALIYFLWFSQLHFGIKTLLTVLGMFSIYVFYGNLGFPNIIGEPPVTNFAKEIWHFQTLTLGKWISPLLPKLLLGIMILFVIVRLSLGHLPTLAMPITIATVYFIVRLFFEREWPDDHERYLSPIYPLFTLILLKLFDQFYNYKWVNYTSQAALWLIVLYNCIRAFKNAWLWHQMECIL